MKKILTKIWMSLIIALIATSLCALPATFAEENKAQDQALTFIKNALPFDLSKYNITLTSHSTLDETALAEFAGFSNSRVIDTVKYTLSSKDGTFDVGLNIENNVVRYCKVSEKTGSIITDKQYTNLGDAVTSFLEKYQSYTKIDSTNLVSMLNNVDASKDSTRTVDNTKFTISNTIWAGKELTSFEWTHTENGADYTKLQVRFQKNGVLYSLRDTRAVYTIGDTSINITKEKAIDIAMKNLPSYSYEMPDNTMVSNFNVTEDYITTKIITAPVKNSEMRPYWEVNLPLNQTYPGSVQGIKVFIWANSGEVISYGNIAYGGINYGDDSDDSILATEEIISSSENSSSFPDEVLAGGIALAAIGLAAGSIVIIKKRKK